MAIEIVYHGVQVPCEEYLRAYEASDWDTVLRYVGRAPDPSAEARTLYDICKAKVELPPTEPPPVELPQAIAKALYGLQRDPEEIEYGGAIDFEMVSGRPAVERIIAYVGERVTVPGEVLRKLAQVDPDYEVGFHTHPGQNRVYPSVMDIGFFLRTSQQAEIIVAGWQMLILTKGPQTPRRLVEKLAMPVREAHGGTYQPERMPELCRALKEVYDIDCDIIDMAAPVKFPLKKGGVR